MKDRDGKELAAGNRAEHRELGGGLIVALEGDTGGWWYGDEAEVPLLVEEREDALTKKRNRLSPGAAATDAKRLREGKKLVRTGTGKPAPRAAQVDEAAANDPPPKRGKKAAKGTDEKDLAGKVERLLAEQAKVREVWAKLEEEEEKFDRKLEEVREKIKSREGARRTKLAGEEPPAEAPAGADLVALYREISKERRELTKWERELVDLEAEAERVAKAKREELKKLRGQLREAIINPQGLLFPRTEHAEAGSRLAKAAAARSGGKPTTKTAEELFAAKALVAVVHAPTGLTVRGHVVAWEPLEGTEEGKEPKHRVTVRLVEALEVEGHPRVEELVVEPRDCMEIDEAAEAAAPAKKKRSRKKREEQAS